MDDPTVQSIIETSTRWLLNGQDQISGGWAERHGTSVNVLNTAEVIIALLDGGLINGAKVEAGDSRIQKAVSFIEEKQTGDEIVGFWQREITEDGTTRNLPDPLRSSFALQALIKAGRGKNSGSVTKGVAWLLKIRNADNGWGYRKGSDSEILPTCCALLSLLKAREAGWDFDSEPDKNPITKGLKSLVENYQDDNSGSFNRSGNYLEGLHTVYAVLVLQAARQSGLSAYIREENNALDWLLQHPDKASRAVEEIIKIDPIRDQKGYGKGDYGFFCNTYLILLKVLSNSAEYSDSKLARNTMITIGNMRDESGGFYGYRVFTWSTAHAICGLNSAKSKFPQIPQSTPEYVGTKVGTPILAFAIVMFLGVVYMSVMGSFKELQAVICAFLMLALLLAYKFIGEKTFAELTKGLGISWSSLSDKKK
ncbi:MAG: hypothetical protein NTY37_03550 [Methanothrix sp.]|nr:hypothetical protein [Methanothrix sp.]